MRICFLVGATAVLLLSQSVALGEQAVRPVAPDSITLGGHVYERVVNATAIIDTDIKSTQQLVRHTRSLGVQQEQPEYLGILGTYRINLSIEKIRSGNVPLAYTAPVFQGTHNTTMFPAPRILLGFKGKPDFAIINGSLRAQNIVGILNADQSETTGVCMLSLDVSNGNAVIELAQELARNPQIAFAEPDMIFQGGSGLIPNDTFFTGGNLWGIHNTGQFGGTPDIDMNGPEAWDITTGDPGVIVVVIDTGVQLDHPDLVVSFGNDFTSDASVDGSPINAFDKHGTGVAGCVNATINNSIGIVGIAPGVSMATARTFISVNSSGAWTSFSSWTVNALNWAASIGARVTVNSNFYGFTSTAIDAAYTNTRGNNNIIHFAIAGNNGDSTGAVYPGQLSSVIAIGAIDRNGILASFSNWGFNVPLFAPGVAIVSTDRTGGDGYVVGDYVTLQGTSFATPYVGGVAALVASQFPSLTAIEIESKILNSTKDLGSPGIDSTYRFGLPDAFNAFSALQTPCLITTDLIADPNTINGSDLGVLLGLWGPVSNPDADFNDDGFVDGADLGMLLGQWGTCP